MAYGTYKITVKLFLTKRLDGLYACSTDTDHELSKKIKSGQSVEFKLANERIMWQHRRFWLALKLAFENMPEQYDTIYPTQEALRKGLLLMAGHVEIQKFADGSQTTAAGSMSFLEMGQNTFEPVYSAVIDNILKYFLDDPDLQRQLIDLI